MKTRLLLTGALAGAGAVTYLGYRKAMRAANARITSNRQFAGLTEFAESGNGPAVLVIHGAGGGFDQGLALGSAFLGDNYRVIAPSRFGYLGTPLPDDASPRAQADQYVRVLDALHLERVPVIGVSAGAPSTMQFALRHPERCSALILAVPLAYPQGERTSQGRPSRLAEIGWNAMSSSDFMFWAASKLAHNALVKTILGTPIEVYESATNEEQRTADAMLASILPISRRSAGLLNEFAVASNLRRYSLAKIAMPALVIGAADCLYGTYDAARYTAEHIPGAKFVSFAEGGHLLVGHGDEVREVITSFLAMVTLRSDRARERAADVGAGLEAAEDVREVVTR